MQTKDPELNLMDSEINKTINLEQLTERLQYQFCNIDLLKQACTHKSFANEQKQSKSQDNERLEFLGDAVLDLVISDMLMDSFPDLPEGGLTKLRAGLVSETGLSKIAQAIDLGEFLLLGKGEELTGGRKKNSILSSSLEAVVAAIYLDTRAEGIGPVKVVIERLFQEQFPTDVSAFFSHDFKTELQELVQKRFHTVIQYKLLKASGPDHQKKFEVTAVVVDQEYGRGVGTSKKQAEQRAAAAALSVLQTSKS